MEFLHDAEVRKGLEAGGAVSSEKVLFTDKMWKFNRYDWKQERNFVITDYAIYNLKKRSRWCVAHSCSCEAPHRDQEDFGHHEEQGREEPGVRAPRARRVRLQVRGEPQGHHHQLHQEDLPLPPEGQPPHLRRARVQPQGLHPNPRREDGPHARRKGRKHN